MKRKSFENWTTDELKLEFGLVFQRKSDLLESWLNAPNAYTKKEEERLSELQETYRYKALFWQEQELIMHFIGPLITLAALDGEGFSGFAGRKVSAHVGDWELTGKVDYMIAMGEYDPREPFFLFHEYKSERKKESDPLGQLLSSMLAAQAQNSVNMPLYGAFVNGRNWFFVVLEGNNYSISLAFDSTQDDLFRIFSILREGKLRIEQAIGLAAV